MTGLDPWRAQHYLEHFSEGEDDTWRVVNDARGIDDPIAVCWSEAEAIVVAGALNDGANAGEVRAEVEDPEAEAFISEILATCRKHGMTLCQSDVHGIAFHRGIDEEVLGWFADGLRASRGVD